tara:strand:- start:16 stop:756 length:741 start_codon:yes stop_codon:yes gene_type:complete
MNKKSKKDDDEIINFYEKMPSKYKPVYHNPSYDRLKINLPFRMIGVGGSGSGKTLIVCNLIKLMNDTFGNIKICCKNEKEPLYQLLKDKIPPEQLQIYEGLSKFPRCDDDEEFDPSLQHLVIFDDLCLEKDQSKIEDLYIRGRKLCKGISCIYLTQSYFKSPKVIRINCGYIILKKLNSKKDLNMILSEYDLGVDKTALQKIYKNVCKTVKDFLFIDMEGLPENRFRDKFKTIIHIKMDDSSDEDK